MSASGSSVRPIGQCSFEEASDVMDHTDGACILHPDRADNPESAGTLISISINRSDQGAAVKAGKCVLRSDPDGYVLLSGLFDTFAQDFDQPALLLKDA